MSDHGYSQRVQNTQKALEAIKPEMSTIDADLLIATAQTQATLAVAAAIKEQTDVLKSISKDHSDIRRLFARRRV